MSAKLLDNFELLAASEGGVAKLRELILSLAVRGKLVPQDPADEPASELLKRIRAEKERLIAERQIRRGKLAEIIPDNEAPCDLPQGWEWAYLGNLGDWGAGATPSRSNSSYYGGTIPWFKSGELTTDYISNSEEFVTDLALKECSLRGNKPGDVLVAMYGATIGKTSILTVPATTNQAVCACTPYSGFDNRYLLLLLKALKPFFISQGAGGAQPNISREKIIATVVGLPPTAEQSRIVAKVEALMALCDRQEAQQGEAARVQAHWTQAALDQLAESVDADEFARLWQALADHFDTLFATPASIDALDATLLQLAVRGKLVPQNPADEPASELLKQIRTEKGRLIAEGKIKRDKPLPPIADDEKPFELPEGWDWARLGQITEIKGGKRLPAGHSFSSDVTKNIYIQVTNMKAGSITSENIKYIADETRALIKQYIISRDDLYITIAGTIGQVGTVPEQFDGMNLTENAARLIFRLVNKHWLRMFLSTEYCQKQFVEKTIQQAQPKLALHRIADALIPISPLPEQSRIVAKLDELFALTRTLRARLTDARAVQAHLASALVEEVAA